MIIVLLFSGDENSSKKVIGGHYRLCPPNPPATPLRSGKGIVCLSRDNRKYCENRIKFNVHPPCYHVIQRSEQSPRVGDVRDVESPARENY